MFGMGFVVLSMSEMASIAPTSGGQYHWVSEFAPAKYQRLASYGVGWFTAIGWQAAVASNALIIAQQIEAIVAFMYPSFDIPTGFNWLLMVLMIAATIVSTVINMYGMRFMPLLEAVVFLLHVAGFFGVLIPLWTLGDVTPPQEVFFNFQDTQGWGSIGVACLVGILGPTITLAGGDSVCHLGEETKDASKALPLSMIATIVLNYIVGFIMTITIVSVGANYSQDIATRTGQPYVAIVYAATGSYAATVTFVILIIFMIFFCTINTITTSSRQLYAFARDGGLPGSKWLSKVSPRTGLPMNALFTTFTITFLLSFIAAASSIAFSNIVSISLVGLLLSYGSTVLTMIFRRMSPEPLPASWLRYPKPLGFAINGLALGFALLAFVFVFFPTQPNPTAAEMNWSVVVAPAIIVFAAIYYLVKGKSTYFGPVARMKSAAARTGGYDDDSTAVPLETLPVEGSDHDVDAVLVQHRRKR